MIPQDFVPGDKIRVTSERNGYRKVTDLIFQRIMQKKSKGNLRLEFRITYQSTTANSIAVLDKKIINLKTQLKKLEDLKKEKLRRMNS